MTSLAEKSMLFITLAKSLPTVKQDIHCSGKLVALWHGLLAAKVVYVDPYYLIDIQDGSN